MSSATHPGRGPSRPPLLVLLLSLVASVGVGGCGGAPETARASGEGGLAGRLVLTGSSTVAPLAGEIGRRFERLHPEVRVDVQTGGSSRGIADALSGVADVGMASRALTEAERARGLIAHPIASDVVGLIVHADNPVRALSDEQVVAIYRGEVDDWEELGGRPGPIVVVNKAEGRATLEVFREHFGLALDEIAADVIAGENQQAIKTVAGNVGAIGYVSAGEAAREVEEGASIGLLSRRTPSGATERFPIERPLLLVTPGAPDDLARAWIEFARSPAVRDLVEEARLVPVDS